MFDSATNIADGESICKTTGPLLVQGVAHTTKGLRKRVMVLDSKQADRRAITRFLDNQYEVTPQGSIGDCVPLALRHEPDIILIDVSEKKIDGFEACRMLKADDRLKHIPVIFLTAPSDSESQTMGLLVGASDYIQKPLNIGIVRQRVGQLIELMEAREKLQQQQRMSSLVFNSAHEGITITDPHGVILDVNDAFTHITGYSRDEVIGKNPCILSSGRQGKDFYAEMWMTIATKGHWYGEIWNRRKTGEVYPQVMDVVRVDGARGQVANYVALFSDITETKKYKSELERIAHFDPLTHLPNRVLLSDRMGQALALALRQKQIIAVAYIDIDGFKAINDTHGHAVGDQFLLTLAGRLKAIMRESDTLARVGSDEFVAMLVDLKDAADSVPTLSRLLNAASQSVHIGQLEIKVSASVGVTFYPQAEDVDVDKLLRQGDQAMYQAKLSGKDRFHFFDAEQDRSVRGRHESLDRIRQGLLRNEFVLHFQPKVNMRTGAIIGAEALIRWQHPQQGLLSPAAFLPVIEDHPLSVTLGEWVIQAALKQLDFWHKNGLQISVSVNLGARQLQDVDFVSRLSGFLAEYPNIAPGDLELELLETSALEDMAHVSNVISSCKAIGVTFALDDFGTGYSSLTYLKRLPVRQLKIDQSFVRNMISDPEDLAIIEGIIGLSNAFGRDVIAEGVETTEHGLMLLRLGCESAQGYGVARPMSGEAMHEWAKSWEPPEVWKNVQVLDKDHRHILLACVQHRAWMQSMAKHLDGHHVAPPKMNADECSIGQWLATTGKDRIGPLYQQMRIDEKHRQFHDSAARLCELHETGQGTAMQFSAMKTQSQELIDMLNEVMSSIQNAAVCKGQVTPALQKENAPCPVKTKRFVDAVNLGDVFNAKVIGASGNRLMLLVEAGVHVIWRIDNVMDFSHYPAGSVLPVFVRKINPTRKIVEVLPAVRMGIMAA